MLNKKIIPILMVITCILIFFMVKSCAENYGQKRVMENLDKEFQAHP